tara:strand:+ start:8718 stop:9092 length:375 start_codon:yes stop_codon:yes gene_type:complete
MTTDMLEQTVRMLKNSDSVSYVHRVSPMQIHVERRDGEKFSVISNGYGTVQGLLELVCVTDEEWWKTEEPEGWLTSVEAVHIIERGFASEVIGTPVGSPSSKLEEEMDERYRNYMASLEEEESQ